MVKGRNLKKSPTPRKLAVLILIVFTYCWDPAFSNMNFTKNKFCICMANENLHHCLRFTITAFELKVKELTGSGKYHFSHQSTSRTTK